MLDLQEIFDIKFNLAYYIVSLISLFLIIQHYVNGLNTRKLQNFLLIVIFIILIVLFGTRTEFVGHDTPRNIKYFVSSLEVYTFSELKDVGLYSISLIAKKFTKSIDVFLTILATMYLLPILIGIRNLNLKNPLVFFFFLFSFFFFKTMGINIQRQGIAFALFFCGITYNLKDKNFISYVLYALAFVFHASIIIPITILFISKKINSIKIPLIVYLAATIFSLANFDFYSLLEQIPIINILVEERAQGYVNISEDQYRVGFRPDFWLFNTTFFCIGLYTYFNLTKFIYGTNFYKMIFYSYTFISSFFFLMFSYGYSDRYGVLSWIYIPFLLLPYVDLRKNIGLFNVVKLFFLCLLIATIFKLFF